MAELLGIREILGESGAALPYGLRKRVELARAIAMEPRLLLLDEPAAGLGHGDRERMMRLIRDLQRLRGITVMLVEHDMHVVMDLADQVVVLDFGRVIAAGYAAAGTRGSGGDRRLPRRRAGTGFRDGYRG